jgi:NAD(P)-dependent dehydrogenase (short-subunit alcohol dehydrogenase family)
VDLAGQRILITGTSAGLGVETARALAAHGASLVCAARDLEKARRALAPAFEDAAAGATIDLLQLDLASLASVRHAADQLVADQRPLSVVIANAGVMACPEGKTADGFETQFGTNHLGHFLFVNRVAALLAPQGRVVCLSSAAHTRSDVDLDDPNFERAPYDRWVAYGRSKTANALFAVALDQRLRRRGMRACSVHPGGIWTELSRHQSPEEVAQRAADRAARGITLKTVPQGAATSVWAAVVAPAAAVGGRYCEDCHVAEVSAGPGQVGVRPYALDAARADALWVKSEEWVGERFAFA